MTILQTKVVAVLVVLASIALFLGATSVVFAQTTQAGSSSQSGAAAGAQAGAAGIIIGGGGAGGAGITGASGTVGVQGVTPSISAFSPVGVGVGGSSRASSNASPTIVVGSGNTYEAADLGDAVPTMFIPNLTTSNGTCMGSFSSGITVSGFGGGLGKTYTSEECNARFNANQMNALGATAVAIEIMCEMDSVYEADMRRWLAGGKQLCSPRSDQPKDPVATWFPEPDKSVQVTQTTRVESDEWVMGDDGMLYYTDTYKRDLMGER